MAKAGLVNYISSARILLSTTQVISSNGGLGPQTGRREKKGGEYVSGCKGVEGGGGSRTYCIRTTTPAVIPTKKSHDVG